MISRQTKEYLDALVSGAERDSDLERFRAEAEEERIPVITPDVERLIAVLLKSSNAKSLFEIGTATGYSACRFADMMGEGCLVKTVERDDYRYYQALENI